jgi:lactoylglutathione lyase
MARLVPMLSCEDLARSLAFYRDLLGGAESYRFGEDGEPEFLTLAIGDSEIGLGGIAAEPMHGLPQRPATGHRIELCVYVDDVDEVLGHALAAGFEALTKPADMPWGERVAWLADPDGNAVMITREGVDLAGRRVLDP